MKNLFNNPVIAVLILLVFLTVGFLALALSGSSTMKRVEWETEIYHVKSGDSLWEISGEYCPSNVDRRDWIAEVKEINGLTSSNIRAGQRLKVLAPEED